MNTTLDLIRAKEPCKEGWKQLLKYLGKTGSDSEPLSLITILESNGLDDALWCLRVTPDSDSKARLFAVFCARQVQHLNPDPRVAKAIDAAEAFALGKATKEELEAARSAAHEAAYSAACATHSAAHSAASYAAHEAAYSAACAASYAAACAASEVATQQAQTEYFKELFK